MYVIIMVSYIVFEERFCYFWSGLGQNWGEPLMSQKCGDDKLQYKSCLCRHFSNTSNGVLLQTESQQTNLTWDAMTFWWTLSTTSNSRTKNKLLRVPSCCPGAPSTAVLKQKKTCRVGHALVKWLPSWQETFSYCFFHFSFGSGIELSPQPSQQWEPGCREIHTRAASGTVASMR